MLIYVLLTLSILMHRRKMFFFPLSIVEQVILNNIVVKLFQVPNQRDTRTRDRWFSSSWCYYEKTQTYDSTYIAAGQHALMLCLLKAQASYENDTWETRVII